MLFDLSSGRRKRFIQVIYATLAILMGGSLVLFGIGSDAPGGILDAVGLGGDGGSGNPQYEQEIEDAEERLEQDPKNQAALLNLARYRALNAQEGIETNPETGETSVSEDAQSELEGAISAWEDYLALDPRRPDAATASQMVTAYRLLLDPGGAAAAQEIVAEDQKTTPAYLQLALFHFADLEFEKGQEAGRQAIETAETEDERKAAERYIAQLEKVAERQERQADQAAEASGAAQGEPADPFGAFGGAGGGVTPPAGG